MKKIFILNVLLLAALLLSACSGASSTTAAASAGYTSSVIKTDYTNALPVVSQLAVGIIKLDEKGSTIDKTEAATLLTLWKTIKTLNASTSSSAEETNAAIRQIEKTLSADQLKAIAGMKLTAQDQATVLANVKVGADSASASSAKTTSSSNSGGGPGGPPGGGGDMMMGGGMGGGQTQTTTTASTTVKTTSSATIDKDLVAAVITFLENK